MLAAAGARAAVIVSSEAEGISIDITTATRSAGLDTALVSGTTPGNYDSKGSAAGVSQRAYLLANNGFYTTYDSISAGAISTEALNPTATSAKGTANVANVSSGLSSVFAGLLSSSLLTIGATSLTSTSTAAVGANGLVGSGSATIGGLALGGSLLAGLDLSAALATNVAANTKVVVPLTGLSIIFNEQITTATGTSALSVETNAVHVLFNNYASNGAILNGDILLGHSAATVTGYIPVSAAVPEPANWMTMILGFGMLGGALRRRPKPALA